MATKIKIGHASISENNTAYGQAGDSTGKEVCINENFDITNLAPTVLLRPNSSAIAEASAKACEAGCANDYIGYSQNGRNTLYAYASNVAYNLSMVKTKCNTDCSAYVTVCAIAGGAKIKYGTNAPTTTNMRNIFKQSGSYSVITNSKYLKKTDYLKRGDILVCEGVHTVMVLENGIKHTESVPNQENSDIITANTVITTYKLTTDITDISKNSAKISFNIIERINEVEKQVSNFSKWNFKLTLIDMNSLKTTDKNIENRSITLNQLSNGTTYIAQVHAIAKDGTEDFCSAPKIFTTIKDVKVSNSIEFNCLKGHDTMVNNIYIKIKDNFKRVIAHKIK